MVVVTLVLIGLTGVYLVSYYAPTLVVPINQLIGNFLMNYATICVEGVIVESPRAELQTGGKIRITLHVNDGSNATICSIVYYYRSMSPEIIPRSIEEIRIEGLTEEVKEIDVSDLPAYVGVYVVLAGGLTKFGYDSTTYAHLLHFSSDVSSARAVGRCGRTNCWGWIENKSLRISKE